MFGYFLALFLGFFNCDTQDTFDLNEEKKLDYEIFIMT